MLRPSVVENWQNDNHIFVQFKVLDLGFNLIRTLPEQAFTGINELTLLALDGNPMATVPEEAFLHLNSSLRGLRLVEQSMLSLNFFIYTLEYVKTLPNMKLCFHVSI